jgi:energy-coupling factor transport system ATP-binding protein
MIEFSHVCFGYDGGRTVEDVSFRLEKGDFAAIIGENGAGKTTISKLCNGLLKPAAGRVTGTAWTRRPPASAAWRGRWAFSFRIRTGRSARAPSGGDSLRAGTDRGRPPERQRGLSPRWGKFGFDGNANPFSMSRGERRASRWRR